MRLLTRYILREVLSHAVLGGVLFTFVFFTTRLPSILEILVRNSGSLNQVARLIAYFIPEVLVLTIPMAVLVGILLGLSRLAADSEITAMRAAGMGALDFVRIISLVSVGALALGLFNSIYLAPKSAAALLRLEESLKYAQASFVVEPRVFDEDYKNLVLYVQDVRPGSGAALWRHVFIADVSDPAAPKITTAEEAHVIAGNNSDLHMFLQDGGEHDISATDKDQYNVSTFSASDLPMQSIAQQDAHLSRKDTPIQALPMYDLLRRATTTPGSTPDQVQAARPYRIEFNKRFSYPFACLVLMLVGVPLGLSSKRGGKSTGFVVTILLVFVYYFLSSIGVALASQGKLSPFLGVWGANLIFAFAGALLLQQLSRGGVALSVFSAIGVMLVRLLDRLRPGQAQRNEADLITKLPQRLRSLLHIQFPLILDEYIMRAFSSAFALVLASFSILFLIFTFFELIGDIIRNRTPLVTVGDYLLNLIPFIVYNVTPLCVLVAVLITFGALARSSEFTAMKAAGFSLYRVVAPVLILAAVLGASLFTFGELELPAANRRQEALRAVIKGRPAQTFLQPDRQWISGQTISQQVPFATPQAPPDATFAPGPQKHLHLPGQMPDAGIAPQNAGEPARIFYYQFFDADKDKFLNLNVFEFDSIAFTVKRRIFARSAHWDPQVDRWIFENGWVRTFTGETLNTYKPFELSTFPEIQEQPQYFKKEDSQPQEMTFGQLENYILDLRQSGFPDTEKLSVQLNKKLAYPTITLVMAILAIPFALATGKRGGVAGFAVAIFLAIVYMGVSSLFEAMGNVNTLPPSLAAWAPDLLFSLAGAWFLLRTPT